VYLSSISYMMHGHTYITFSKSITSLHYETICNSEIRRRMMGDSEGKGKGEVHSRSGHEGPEG